MFVQVSALVKHTGWDVDAKNVCQLANHNNICSQELQFQN